MKMTLIEGVGDEVVQFIGVVLVAIVAALAWWSTNARPDRYRTMLVMRSRTHHPVTVSIRTRTVAVSDSPQDNRRVIPLQEMDSIVDADMAMMDNNRLHFYRRIDSPNNTNAAAESTSDESETPEDPEPASNAQMREMDSIVSAMEADVNASHEFLNNGRERSPDVESVVQKQTQNELNKEDNSPNGTSNSNNTVITADSSVENASGDTEANVEDVGTDETSDGDTGRRKILIKLKYLNDTLKEVEGSLDELLKDFKRRHFSSELSASHRVMLIFNGRMLADEAATLAALGLHDRAVVHCLVSSSPTRDHNIRPFVQRVQEDSTPLPQATEAGGPQQERAWDLENVFMTLVSVALTVLWFFRCEYSNMFTASASVALFGLTMFYSVAIFGLYLSDTFHFDRRPQQPAPNN